MKLISNNGQLESELCRCIKEYNHIKLAVAWATMSNAVSQLLSEHCSKLEQAVIGTHFYQTDPEFISCFNKNPGVKFMKNTSGVFHPKVFVFISADTWEIFIGSANLTGAAFSKNDEICLHLTEQDDSENVVQDFFTQLTRYSSKAGDFSEEELEAYRTLYRANKFKIKALENEFGGGKQMHSALSSSIITRDWQEHVKLVKDDRHGIDERLELLETIRDGFRNNLSFNQMDLGLRKTIAGLPTDWHKHWGWFGSMKPLGRYHKRINENDENISNALSFIALEGEVNESNYLSFIEHFKKAFPDGSISIAAISRLLAMKRPDVFICIDGKNKANLCKNFGITQSSINYQTYWSEVIARIQASAWWMSERPQKSMEAQIWDSRAALLDCIFYEK